MGPGTPPVGRKRPKRAPQPRRLPQRTCVGCRTALPKRQLVRLVRLGPDSVAVDPTGKAAGRGAYLHDRRDCWQRALAGRGLEQALRVELTEADRARLRAHADQYANDDQ
jgi:predicted RNA-binding protein YlxR (DUF448 family)